MKYLSDKKVRAVIYIMLIIVADLFNNGGPASFIIVFFQGVCAILLLYTLYSMIMDRYRRVEDKVMGTLGRFIMRFFAPIAGRMARRLHKNSSFVVGTDRFEYVGHSFRRDKKKRRKLRKINFSGAVNNCEKVRLAYVKYLLSSVERGMEFTYADTPYEIDVKLDTADDKVLFDTYVGVRYKEKYVTDTNTADKCVQISDK